MDISSSYIPLLFHDLSHEVCLIVDDSVVQESMLLTSIQGKRGRKDAIGIFCECLASSSSSSAPKDQIVLDITSLSLASKRRTVQILFQHALRTYMTREMNLLYRYRYPSFSHPYIVIASWHKQASWKIEYFTLIRLKYKLPRFTLECVCHCISLLPAERQKQAVMFSTRACDVWREMGWSPMTCKIRKEFIRLPTPSVADWYAWTSDPTTNQHNERS